MAVEGKQKFRNEWKYSCTTGQLALLSERIEKALSVDGFAFKHNQYCVHSLYFDDYKNTCAKDNAAGASDRYKWRIRYYDGPKPSLHLEYKHKYFGRTHKTICPITKNELRLILDGRPEEVIWKTRRQLTKRFCIAIMTKHFTPKTIIYYERTAFVEPIANIRITMDRNISTGNDFQNFLTGKYSKYPILGKDNHILEVKFDNILPGYVRNLIGSHNFKQTTFSKYYYGRKKLEQLV